MKLLIIALAALGIGSFTHADDSISGTGLYLKTPEGATIQLQNAPAQNLFKLASLETEIVDSSGFTIRTIGVWTCFFKSYSTGEAIKRGALGPKWIRSEYFCNSTVSN